MGIDSIIFEYRKKSGLSQIDLAEKVGVSGKTISRWEKGISTPDVYSLKKISVALNIPFNTFYDEINKIEVESIPINSQFINRYMSYTIISICILLISFLLVLFSLNREDANSTIVDIAGIIGLVLIIISITVFIISNVNFYNQIKYSSTLNIYKKHLFISFSVYLLFILPYLIFIFTSAF